MEGEGEGVDAESSPAGIRPVGGSDNSAEIGGGPEAAAAVVVAAVSFIRRVSRIAI